MATISKRRRNEASILTSFSLSKPNEPAYSRTCKDRSKKNLLILHLRKIKAKQILFIPQIRKIEAEQTLFIPQIGQIEVKRTLFIPQIGKIEAQRSLFIPQIRKIEVERTRLIPEIGKIEAKKTNWIEVVFLKLLWSPGINSKKLIPPAFALGGLYNNPIPVRFLAPLDCSKAP
jgi:hypothetical protein